jgi:hypothetical protein
MREARSAGTEPAASVTTLIATIAMATVSGSRGDSP